MIGEKTLIEAEKLLADVHPDREFMLNDGSKITNLNALYDTLQRMDAEVFKHHVNDNRNDFGTWVKDVHKDYKLANSLFTASNKDDSVRAVGERIYEIENMLKPSSNVQQTSMMIVSQPKTKLDETAGFKSEKIKRKPSIEEKLKPESKITEQKKHSATQLPEKEDPCTELIRFAEESGFAGKLIKDVSSIFTKPDITGFANDMKKIFTSSNEADDFSKIVINNPEESISENPDEKKDDIMEYLKKVYK